LYNIEINQPDHCGREKLEDATIAIPEQKSFGLTMLAGCSNVLLEGCQPAR
jgi:hypothetical protein